MASDDIVHQGDTAFRIRVDGGLVFEHLEWPSLKVRSEVTLPYPNAGYGGAQLSLSPGLRFAGAALYSGQSETGYELFALTPKFEHIGGLPYVQGEWDLTPVAFSPDERFAALAVERSLWWVDPDHDDPDWDTPAEGGVVTWATLYVHVLGERAPREHRLLVDLPEGWVPDNEDGTYPEELAFSGKKTLVVGLPWADDFEFELPVPGGDVMVDPPED